MEEKNWLEEKNREEEKNQVEEKNREEEKNRVEKNRGRPDGRGQKSWRLRPASLRWSQFGCSPPSNPASFCATPASSLQPRPLLLLQLLQPSVTVTGVDSPPRRFAARAS